MGFVTIPIWLLVALVVAAFGPVVFLMRSQIASLKATITLQREMIDSQAKMIASQAQTIASETQKIISLQRENGRLQGERTRDREECERSWAREKKAQDDGVEKGRSDALASIKVLMKTKYRVLDKGFLQTETERSNLFLVIAGDEVRAGYVGEEQLTADELRKLIETMKIVSDIVGCHPISAVTDVAKKIMDQRHVN